MSSGNILVVDDEPQIRRVMRMALSSQGFEVIEARSGEEGLEKFREHLPDLVLLDLNMPGIGAWRRAEASGSAPKYRSSC